MEEKGALLFYEDHLMFRYREKDHWLTKCVSPEAVRAAFSSELMDTGWMPPSVRRWGTTVRGDWLVLFSPPARHRLFLQRTGRGDKPDPRPKELTLPLPALVFMGFEMNYYVWAIREAELQPNAMTYHVPLPNISDSGWICLGANRYPSASCETIGETWRLFLESPFNDHHANGKSHSHPRDIRRQMIAVARQGRRRYPLGDLVPYHRTVEQSVQAILERRL